MAIAIPTAIETQELNRLKLLIPERMQAAIEIESSRQTDDRLITVKKMPNRCVRIQIDLLGWLSLNLDIRNLLFWHEIARIETGAIGSDRAAHLAIGAGVSIAAIGPTADNIGMLAAALLVSGLASFRLYQKYWGEQNLRRLTAADRGAIAIAVACGYDRQIARELLQTAIQITMKKSRSQFRRDRCAARLQVLAIT